MPYVQSKIKKPEKQKPVLVMEGELIKKVEGLANYSSQYASAY